MNRVKMFDISIYVIIAFVISIPFISGKYFLLDTIQGANIYSILDLFYSKDIPIYGGTFLPFVIATMLSESSIAIIYFISILLSGYLMYDTVGNITSSRISKLYAGILYAVNPYTYTRMVVGQWVILFAYATLPLLIKSFIEFLEKKERKSAIKFIFFMSLVAFNIHMLIIALIIMSIIFIFWSFKYRDIRNIKIIPIVMVVFILLNFYWIFPLITAKNTMVDNIGKEDYKVFTPKVNNLSDLFNIASMYGFWREGYIYAKDFIPYWQLLSLFIILLAVYGFISYYKDDKIGYLVKALGVIGIIGFILATGINGPFGDLNHWLYDNTILKGFRDSHKFVAMIVFAYAILGGLGIEKLSKKCENDK